MAVERVAPILDRAWVFEGPGGPYIQKAVATTSSQQLPEDPYNYSDAGEAGLVRPPFDLDQLVSLMGGKPGGTGNSLHTRCVKQKASDTVGRGIDLRVKDDENPTAAEEDRWGQFIDEVENDERGEGSFKERVTWAHEDYESTGWGILEVGRTTQDSIDGLWHIPAHTMRAHQDGKRFAQKRSGKLTWFKRFGVKGDVDREKGTWSDKKMAASVRGNEVIVVRNYTPVTSYYGLPDHIPAIMAMAGWNAQAEFNVRFFGNQAVPSYAVIVEGADLTPELESLILDHFRAIKGDPARTIVIPVPVVPGVGEAFQPKVRFERLSVEVKEASFRMYRQDTALEICIAHGVPPYRIGWPLMGSLGGATALEMTQIYNDGIVQPRQETWEQRLDRALLGEKGLNIDAYGLKCHELDVRNEMNDLQKSRMLYEMGVVTPADNANYWGYERKDAAGQRYIDVPLAPGAPAPGSTPSAPEPGPLDPSAVTANAAVGDDEMVEVELAAKAWGREVAELARLRKAVEGLVGTPAEFLDAAKSLVSKDWDESLHPRDESGRFSSGGGSDSDVLPMANRTTSEVVERISDPRHPLHTIYHDKETGRRLTTEERHERAANVYRDVNPADVTAMTMEEFRAMVDPRASFIFGEGGVSVDPYPETADHGEGTRLSPFITSDPDRFAEAIAQGKYADLQQPRGISTLVDELAAISLTAVEQGERAPAIDLGKVTINGTNAFVGESLGIPRAEMPQLSGPPEPGSKADDESQFPKDSRGGVDLADAFTQHLEAKGITVANEVVPAEWLRATQSEIDGVKTGGIAHAIIDGVNGNPAAGPAERRIFVTKDDYILDGHHTWSGILAAQLAEGENHEVKVARIDMGISDAMREAHTFAADMGIAPRALGKRHRRKA